MGMIEATIQLFFEEAEDHLAVLEEGLLRLETEGCSQALIDELLRAAHTLKGSAGLMKLDTIGAVAHCLEDTMEGVRDAQATPSVEMVDALLFALDQIRDLVDRAMEGTPEPQGVLDRVKRLLGARQQEDAVEAQPAPEEPQPIQELPAAVREEVSATNTVRVGSSQIEKMMSLLGELTVTSTHLDGQLGVMEAMREEVDRAGQRLVSEVNRFSDRYAYALPDQQTAVDCLLSDFEDLEFDRYDELNLFSRTLQEVTSDINEALRTLSRFFAEFAGGIESVDRVAGELKERISEARTVRASRLFQRFTRSIRELSRQAGKRVELTVTGGETPIDRVLFDGLYDPLLHILRNAIAHGFETPEERVACGKAEQGRLSLSARRVGATIEIEVRDDGRGLQLDRIRQQGEERGLIAPGQLLGEQELVQLIFKPGFTTRGTTDSISGRGVGMDVVVERLALLNGTIDIQTEAGVGTAFTLNLPLSLVIVNVIQFRLGNQLFVIPSSLISEVVDLPFGELGPESIDLRGESVPTKDLTKAFGLHSGDIQRRFAVVTKISGASVALLVDAIISQEDTVIKPFGSFLQQMPFFSGTSMSGDGSLRLVVNPSRVRFTDQTGSEGPTVESAPLLEDPAVLVVDDSLSVRKYASMTLEAAGFRILTATNGLEALEVLEDNPVALIITDLEMPVMHGYELLQELNRRNLLPQLPVAVLSSRGGSQHREKAAELGACEYIVKPFEEENLISLVRRYLESEPV